MIADYLQTSHTDPRRAREYNTHPLPEKGPVVYWMSRDQRAHENHALLYAQEIALRYSRPLVVVFALQKEYGVAQRSHFDFMLRGLREVEIDLAHKHIPFHILEGEPVDALTTFCHTVDCACLITDFSPLRLGKTWRYSVAEKLDIPFIEVDAHNIIPCWITSPKQEFAAYTIRPKIARLLSDFLKPYPPLISHPHTLTGHAIPVNAWTRLIGDNDSSLPWKSGYQAGMRHLDVFLHERMKHYASDRHNALKSCESDLSPHLHFGQISAQQVAFTIHEKYPKTEGSESFLEEIIVRRELAENFCYYNPDYDSVSGFPAWAQASLHLHEDDARSHLYTQEQFESAMTHDPLWNAAQREMMRRGKMHGYMRMYWAKKILEWTTSPEEALRIAIYLNDHYSLDGRDPNGYAGIAWSIGGVHDRAWFKRPVFGQIRYMNETGVIKHFSMRDYIDKWSE